MNTKKVMKKFDIREKDLKIKSSGKPIREIKFINLKSGVSANQIKNIVDEMNKITKSPSGHKMFFSIATRYEGNAWRSSDWKTIDKKANVFNIYDYYDEKDKKLSDAITKLHGENFENFKYKEFRVYYGLDIRSTAGGWSKYNSCLFWALKTALGDDIFFFKSDISFKSFLRIPRDSKVSIDLIPKIEDKMSTCINIEGDVIVISKKEYQRSVYISLIDGHYKIKNRNFNNRIKHPAKKVITWNRTHYYDGKNKYLIKLKSLPNVEKRDKGGKLRDHDFKKNTIDHMVNDDADLVEEHNKLMDAINKLKELDPELDLIEFGTPALLAYFDWSRIAYKMDKPPRVNQLEGQWLTEATSGAVMFCENKSKEYVTYKNAIHVDVNAMYPYLMKEKLIVGNKEAKFTKLDKLPDILPYGIYHCNIYDPKDNKFFKYARLNKYDKYTHLDIKMAIKYGAKVELHDEEYNLMYYDSKSRILGKNMYGEFVDKWVDICRKIKHPIIKLIRNALWGIHSQSRVKTLCNIDEYDIRTDYTIENCAGIVPNKDNYDLQIRDKVQMFKYPYARIKPFIYSYGRQMILNTIMSVENKYPNSIVWCHTDGFICTKDCTDLMKISNEIGDFKIEHKGDVKIKNLCDPKKWV